MRAPLARTLRRMTTAASPLPGAQTHDVAKINNKLDAIIAKQRSVHWLAMLTFGITFGHIFGPTITRRFE